MELSSNHLFQKYQSVHTLILSNCLITTLSRLSTKQTAAWYNASINKNTMNLKIPQ